MAFPYSSGDVLTAADLNQSSGLVLVKAVTIGSSVSSITVSDAFSSTFNNYKVMIGGGVGTALADINLKLGSTTTGYYAGYSRVNYSGASAALASDNNASAFSRFGSASTDTLFANCDFFNPYATKRTIINGFNAFQNSSISGGAFGGFLDDATSYTDFTLVISAGTATGGTIRVYGYNNG